MLWFRATLHQSRRMGTRAFFICAVAAFLIFPSYALSRVSTALSTVRLDNNGQHEGGRFSMPRRTTVVLTISVVEAGLLASVISGLPDARLSPVLNALKAALAHEPIQTGQRFGQMTVLRPAGKRNYRPFWWCSCDCGAIKQIGESSLRKGTRSCGCLSIKHGRWGTPEYRIWGAMVQRCHNPNTIGYENYGGRGIFVCDQWRADFTAFYTHVGARPAPELTLERIDNNKGYEPGNVRWATRSEQNRNKRGVHLVTFEDHTQCLTDWAEGVGVSASSLDQRIKIRGLDQALTAPKFSRHSGILLTANNQTLTLSQWADITGIDRDTLDARYRSHWTHEQIVNTPIGKPWRRRRKERSQ